MRYIYIYIEREREREIKQKKERENINKDGLICYGMIIVVRWEEKWYQYDR